MAEVATLNQLSLQELSYLHEILNRVTSNRRYNRARLDYYDAHNSIKDLGIAVPPQLKNTMQAVGWPGLVVDSLEERLNLRGLYVPGMDADALGITSIWRDNELDLLYPEAHVDAMVSGVTFLAASKGLEDEPDYLITLEAAENFSGIYDPRKRRLTAAGGVTEWGSDGQPKRAALYVARQTIFVVKEGTTWRVEKREPHRLNRPAVRRMVNRSRGSRQWGKSEITRPVISYTESAARTLLGAEVSREFYQSPQRWIMGADEDAFKDAQGNPASPWKSYMGRFLALTRDDDGNIPQVGEFSAASPAPYIEMVKMYSQLVAGEAGLNASRLGFVSDNPTSADAIRADENRHVARAERRQTSFGSAWRGITLDVMELRDGKVDEEIRYGLACDWINAATPTTAAAGDRAVKLVGAKVLPAGSKVLLKELGYNEAEIRTIEEERRLEQGSELATMLRAQAVAAAANNPQVAQMAQRTAPPEGE